MQCMVSLDAFWSINLPPAGDYVKFGYPMASALTTLAWGGLSYPAAYQAAGQAEHLRAAVRWGTDYLLKAHVGPEQFYCQVLHL